MISEESFININIFNIVNVHNKILALQYIFSIMFYKKLSWGGVILL